MNERGSRGCIVLGISVAPQETFIVREATSSPRVSAHHLSSVQSSPVSSRGQVCSSSDPLGSATSFPVERRLTLGACRTDWCGVTTVLACNVPGVGSPLGGGEVLSGVMKWSDTQNQEAWGEGPRPLPKVRQVWKQAPKPSYLVPPHFNSYLKLLDTHQGSECPVPTDITGELKRGGTLCQKFGVSPHFIPPASRFPVLTRAEAVRDTRQGQTRPATARDQEGRKPADRTAALQPSFSERRLIQRFEVALVETSPGRREVTKRTAPTRAESGRSHFTPVRQARARRDASRAASQR